jgi:hypothetical protein
MPQTGNLKSRDTPDGTYLQDRADVGVLSAAEARSLHRVAQQMSPHTDTERPSSAYFCFAHT